MKKKIIMMVSLLAIFVVTLTGTVAYLTDTDEAVNVMVVGNVDIEQHEYERVVDENGNYVKVSDEEYKLQEFTQAKPALPAYYGAGLDWDEFYQPWGQVGAPGSNDLFAPHIANVIDKFVFVENTGKNDVYYRTIIAIEAPVGLDDDKMIHTSFNANSRFDYNDEKDGVQNASDADTLYITIDGTRYLVYTATYTDVLTPGEVSRPSLLQVFLDPEVTNEQIALFGDTWEILTYTQAVQADMGAADANEALVAAFDEITVNNHPWVDGVDIPKVLAWEGVNYITEGDTATAVAGAGDTVYRGIFSDGLTNATSVVIGEGIVRLNNRALCKAPTITNVELPDTLTYIDESAFQQSGITEIEIPENVTYIGKQAFGACDFLETIKIKAKDVTIGNYVARACPNLKEVYIYGDVTFETGSMYFTNKENADASGITFYVKDQVAAENLYSAFSTSHSYGLLIKSLDGATTYYDTLK